MRSIQKHFITLLPPTISCLPSPSVLRGLPPFPLRGAHVFDGGTPGLRSCGLRAEASNPELLPTRRSLPRSGTPPTPTPTASRKSGTSEASWAHTFRGTHPSSVPPTFSRDAKNPIEFPGVPYTLSVFGGDRTVDDRTNAACGFGRPEDQAPWSNELCHREILWCFVRRWRVVSQIPQASETHPSQIKVFWDNSPPSIPTNQFLCLLNHGVQSMGHQRLCRGLGSLARAPKQNGPGVH